MVKYFANNNKFTPSWDGHENGLQPIDNISGTLISSDIRPGRSPSGFWLVFNIKKTNGYYIDVFFDALNSSETNYTRYNILCGKTVTIKSIKGIPNIETVCTESEDSVRASLLKGVADGIIKMEDLPILLEVAKGKDVPFEKWDVFKQQLENERLAVVKEKTVDKADTLKKQIELEESRLHELKELLRKVDEDKTRMLTELYSSIMFLQGDKYPNNYLAYQSENLVNIGDGYNRLIEAFQKFRTKKGVYVICEDRICHIHDAYLEPDGRAFLLGATKSFKRTKVEEILDKIDSIRHPHSSPESTD